MEGHAMINFDESVRAIVFCAFADRADFLASVSDNPQGAGLVLLFRLRFYAEGLGDPFDDRDRKTWFQAQTSEPLATAIEKLQHTGTMLATVAGLAGRGSATAEFFTLVRGASTLDEFVAAFRAAPFVHERMLQ
jgi:hypothetical protein